MSLYLRRLQIISEDGLTLFVHPDSFSKNPQLISGMLSALFLFIKEEYGGNVKSIMLSDRKINFVRYGSYLVILEMESFVDDGCANVFFTYLLDLLTPVFEKAGSNYNLAISLLEGLSLPQIFDANRQLEILEKHDIPQPLSNCYLFLRKGSDKLVHQGEIPPSKTRLIQREVSDSSDAMLSYHTTIFCDDRTDLVVMHDLLPVHDFEMILCVPESLEQMLVNISNGIHSMLSNILDLYPNMDVSKLMEYLVSLRLPSQIVHKHEPKKSFDLPKSFSNPIKLSTLAMELLENSLPVFTEKLLLGEKICIVGSELSCFAVNVLIQELVEHQPINIGTYSVTELPPSSQVVFCSPRLSDSAKDQGYFVIAIGSPRRGKNIFADIYSRLSILDPENRLIQYLEKVKNIHHLYGDLLFCLLGEFDQTVAKRRFRKLKERMGSKTFSFCKSMILRKHPQLEEHLQSFLK